MADSPKKEFSELTFEILRAAVTIARNQQIKSVKTLKELLALEYPGHGEDIDLAISTWARRVEQTRQHLRA